jgi:hypothetical protein
VGGTIVRTRIFAFAALILSLALPSSGQPIGGKAKPAVESGRPNYTITLVPPDGPKSLKSPLLIETYYTNTTGSDIYMLAVICGTCTAEQMLLMKDGKEVETTPWQRVSTGRGQPSDWEQFPNRAGDSRVDRYPPGVFWRVKLDLRKFYHITEPGQYTLTASRTEWTGDGKVVVRSNSITFDIVP